MFPCVPTNWWVFMVSMRGSEAAAVWLIRGNFGAEIKLARTLPLLSKGPFRMVAALEDRNAGWSGSLFHGPSQGGSR